MRYCTYSAGFTHSGVSRNAWSQSFGHVGYCTYPSHTCRNLPHSPEAIEEQSTDGFTIVRVLEFVYVENYKCLVDFPLNLQGTTLLLGANGTGKTAVLDVVYGLRKLLAGEAKITDPIAFPPSTLTRWQTHRHQQFILQTRVGNESFIYALQIEHDTASGTSWVAHEGLVAGDSTVLFSCTKGEVQLYRDDGSAGPTYRTDWSESALARVVPHPTNTRLSSFLNAVRNTVVCTIQPQGLRVESNREAPAPRSLRSQLRGLVPPRRPREPGEGPCPCRSSPARD